jgi:hypothetical protein
MPGNLIFVVGLQWRIQSEQGIDLFGDDLLIHRIAIRNVLFGQVQQLFMIPLLELFGIVAPALEERIRQHPIAHHSETQRRGQHTVAPQRI